LFLFGVPWYVYAGVLAVAAIPVYSFLWCVNRDLTEEDYKSDAAENFALTAFAALALAFAITAFALTAFAFALALALTAFAFALTLALAEPPSKWYYVGRFFGAVYYHYCKSKTNSKPQKQ
jgi:hypothetical protein